MSLELAAQADEFNEAIKEPPPEVGKAAPTIVSLIRGVVDPDTGEWQTTATVREMTGEDEEELARLSDKDDLSYADYTSALLSRAVERIGTHWVAPDPSILDYLIIGDRDLLFLGVIKATYGNRRTFTVLCPQCSTKNDVRVDLDKDFPVKSPINDPRKTKSVKLKGGQVVRVKIPTGRDAKAIAGAETLAKQNTEIVTQCVVWDDDRTEPVRRQWAREISVADRRTIVDAVLEDQPGPSLEEVKAPCANCDDEITMVLDWASLLFS
jgi:hypothetical protein